MSTRKLTLAVAAIAALATSTLVPAGAAASGHGNLGAVPVKVVSSHPTQSFGRGYGRYGWGYGPGWCYWHPYVCYRR